MAVHRSLSFWLCIGAIVTGAAAAHNITEAGIIMWLISAGLIVATRYVSKWEGRHG